MNTLDIIIMGKPISKARPRKGKYGNMYNSQRDVMQRVKREIQQQIPVGYECIAKGVPVHIDILFLFNPLKTEKNRTDQDPYIKKPDIDNVEKFAMDCMSAIIFHDDNQVCTLNSSKRYIVEGSECTMVRIKW